MYAAVLDTPVTEGAHSEASPPLTVGDGAGRAVAGGGNDMENVALFDAWQKRRNLATSTIKGRRLRLTGFSRFLQPDSCLLEATTVDIEGWFDTLGGKRGLAPQTRHAYTRQLAAFYHWAQRARIIMDDPTEDVVRPRLPRPLPRPIDPVELMRAIDAADDRKAAMLALAGFAGLRCQEIAGLRVEDIDWRRKKILVVHAKGGKERMMPMHPEVEFRLRRVVPSHGYVFHRVHPVGPEPIKPGTVSQFLSEFLHEMGIAASAHNGRHLFLTSVYESSLDIRVTQELAGHASPTTTARYAAWSQARGVEAVGALSYR